MRRILFFLVGGGGLCFVANIQWNLAITTTINNERNDRHSVYCTYMCWFAALADSHLNWIWKLRSISDWFSCCFFPSFLLQLFIETITDFDLHQYILFICEYPAFKRNESNRNWFLIGYYLVNRWRSILDRMMDMSTEKGERSSFHCQWDDIWLAAAAAATYQNISINKNK